MQVRSSDGMLRQQSAGAAAIRALRQLPGVGCRAAGRLYAAGITSLAQLHAACEAGERRLLPSASMLHGCQAALLRSCAWHACTCNHAGTLPEGLLTGKQLFAAQHWRDLTEGISAADVSTAQQVRVWRAELLHLLHARACACMRAVCSPMLLIGVLCGANTQAVAAAAASVSGVAGWTAQLVGGASRGKNPADCHDLDLLLWHPRFTTASSEQHPRLLERLQQQLVAQGELAVAQGARAWF